MKFETEDFIVEVKDDDLTRDAVFEAVVKFFKEREAFSGECIMQSDACNLAAPEFLAELADDILKFDVEYKEK